MFQMAREWGNEERKEARNETRDEEERGIRKLEKDSQRGKRVEEALRREVGGGQREERGKKKDKTGEREEYSL